MASHVHLLPTGHDFISEGKSSLLEAGLRAGLALNYGCSNGNCGRCLARIVSGKVEKTQHHDYRISEHQKASGHVLMCCNSAVGDVVLEASEASSTSEIPHQQISTRVRDISVVNDDVALVHLKTPRTQRLRFLAGQHVLLGVDDIPPSRFSVGSCPCDDRNLHFQVPMLLDDEFSDHVFNKLERGDMLDVTGPGGDFVLDENSSRSLVFVAWRTGFAPIRSLIEHAMSLDVAETIHLVWIAANQQDRYLDNLCRSWADAFDDLNYVPVDAVVGDLEPDGSQLIFKRLNLSLEELSSRDFYIAGNQAMMDVCRTALADAGLPPVQIATDRIVHD